MTRKDNRTWADMMDVGDFRRVYNKMADNPKIDSACVHMDGFVPNSYKFRAPGKMVRVYRDARVEVCGHDRKRSGGSGTRITYYNAKGNAVRV